MRVQDSGDIVGRIGADKDRRNGYDDQQGHDDFESGEHLAQDIAWVHFKVKQLGGIKSRRLPSGAEPRR